MKNICPKCKNIMILQEGCSHCQSCGYSECETLELSFTPDFGSNVKFTKE